MRSRTSRGVPEWSGGKDLYMGSPVLVTGKVSGVIGNVLGLPGGSQGSNKWGHWPQRAPWDKCGRVPAPGGLVHPPTIYRGRGEGPGPFRSHLRGGGGQGGRLAPQAKGVAPLGFPPNPRHMGPRGVGTQPT